MTEVTNGPKCGVSERALVHHARGWTRVAAFLHSWNIDFTVPSLTGLGDRHFGTVWDMQNEVGNARIWGGIHFRSAVQDGIAIGNGTVRQVLAHHFQRSWHY